MQIHPLNIRKHFHVILSKISGGRPTNLKIFQVRENANAYARMIAIMQARDSKTTFKGGSFGSSSLAFYAVNNKFIEVTRCEEPGTKHRVGYEEKIK